MSMNDDIYEFGVYGLTHNGKLVRVPVFSTSDYNHNKYEVHHYIKQQNYRNNKEWFKEHNIKQKLILLPKWLHLIVHSSPYGAKLSDKEFEEKFKISRWDLVFNRRYSEY